MVNSNAGKGSGRRPPQISPELEALRYDLAYGKISPAEYNKQYKQLEKEGKTKIIYRW